MNKNILVIVLFSISVTVFSQTEKGITVQGRIKDSITNNPLEYATVRLFDTTKSIAHYGAVTNDKGVFTIQHVTLKEYVIIITYIGYEKKELTIYPPLNKEVYKIDILLSPDKAVLEEVEIIAESVGTTRITIDRNIF
jgi:hypothetical protein